MFAATMSTVQHNYIHIFALPSRHFDEIFYKSFRIPGMLSLNLSDKDNLHFNVNVTTKKIISQINQTEIR